MKDRNSLYKRASIPQAGFLPTRRDPALMKSSDPAGILAAELLSSVRGEVRFDNGSRALYATDASNYRQVPVGVVIPKDVDDVIKTIAAARRYGTPIFTRGGDPWRHDWQ